MFQRGIGLKQPEDEPAFLFYLAGALALSDRTDEALAAARKAAELRRNSPRFSSRLPWVLDRAKRYDEAIEAYVALLARFDGPPGVKMQELLRSAGSRWPDAIGTSWRPTPWPPRPSTTSVGRKPATPSARPARSFPPSTS